MSIVGRKSIGLNMSFSATFISMGDFMIVAENTDLPIWIYSDVRNKQSVSKQQHPNDLFSNKLKHQHQLTNMLA